MFPARRRSEPLTALILLLALPLAALAANPPQVRVEALLDALRRSGVEIIYSSALVPPGLTAPPADPAAPLLERVERALASAGLALRRAGDHTFVVVRAAPPPAPPAAAPADAPLEEISVYASRYALGSGTLAQPREMSAADLAMVPGSGDDALRALRVLPGLASNASARPYIRGSLTEDVLVRYDGIALLDPFHLKNFQSLISAIDPAAIERIEVFSGGFPVRYGTRSGGVIDIGAPSLDRGSENRVSAGTLSAGASSVGHAGSLPFEWLAALRLSTLDMIEPVEEGFGKPRFSDSLGRLRWQTDHGAWTAGWLLLDDRLTLGGEDNEEHARAHYRDEYFWLARDHAFGDSVHTRGSVVVTSAERTRDGTMIRPGVSSGSLDEAEEFNGFELANDWTWDRNPRSRFDFGGGLAWTRADYRYARHSQFAPDVAAVFGRAEVEDLVADAKPAATTWSLYASNRRKWARIEAELGVRADGQDFAGTGSRAQVSPRFNMRFDVNPRLRLYASAGKFTQAQHVEEWRSEEGQQRPDASLTAIHSILGAAYETGASTRLGLELYTKRWTTVAPYFDSRLDPFTLLPELAPDRVRISARSSEASGIELSARSSVSERLTAWGTFAWSRVADDLGGNDVRRSWDQPLSASAGLAWSGARASLSALALWHRGWPRTPLTITTQGADPAGTLALGARNSARWNDYVSLDLSGRWTWPFVGGELSAELSVSNATHRDNECCVMLERPAGSGFEAEPDYWLPTVASLGFTYRWKNP